MKWLSITAVFFLVTLAKSVPTKSNNVDPDPGKERTIESITRNSDQEFALTLSDIQDQTTSHTVLTVKKGGAESNLDANQLQQSKTYTFNDDLKILSGAADVGFLLTTTGDDGEQLAFADKEIGTFPVFPNVADSWTLIDPRNLQDNLLFRVPGSLGDMSLNSLKNLVSGDPSYFECTQSSPATDYNPCTKIGVDPVVCDEQLAHDTAPCDTASDILDTAILSYGTDSSLATVKIMPKTPPEGKYEVILSSDPPVKNALCIFEGTQQKDCAITWEKPSENTLQLIIIKLPISGVTESWTTGSVVIQDRELYATKLGTDIIEGRWKILGENPIYQLVKTDTAGTKATETITVNCENLSQATEVCFGYFPNLSPAKYTLTVAYQITGTPGTYNKLDQIESSQVDFTSTKLELAILSRHTTRHQNQLMTEVKICFEHLTPPEGRSFSHYEMLIINEKGQWLKHKIIEEEGGEGGICFAPFTISTKDFDLTEGTKVVVSQRGVDGVTVLATGESLLF